MPDTQAQNSSEAKRKSPKAIIAAVCVVAVVAGGVGLYASGVIGPKEEDDGGVRYAAEGVMILEDTGGIYDVLEPNSIACYLGNSALNEYDMYVAIYSDAELTDLLYMSGLVPPGSGFEEITLDKELEKGDHRVYIAFTQMEDPKTIHAQTIYTMDFHVILD